MAVVTATILQPMMIRASSSYSRLSHSLSRLAFFCKLETPKTCMKKLLKPVLLSPPPTLTSHWHCRLLLLCPPRFRHIHQHFSNSGLKFGMKGIVGASVVLGSSSLWPRIAYAMNDFDILVDDHRPDLLAASGSEEDPHTFLNFARKLLVPVFLFVTVLMNWGHPIILAAKIILILLSTKPSPFSVYLFIEQLRRQYMHQHPFWYKFKSLYAKQVEVEDYMFLCLARVELKDEIFTLIGILGSWWVLPVSTCHGVFSRLRNRALRYRMII